MAPIGYDLVRNATRSRFVKLVANDFLDTLDVLVKTVDIVEVMLADG